eukprot:1119808-Rhodomonas_salina.8
MVLEDQAFSRPSKYVRSPSSVSSTSPGKVNASSHRAGHGRWHQHAGSTVWRRLSVYLLLLIAALMAIILVKATSPKIRLRRSTTLRTSHALRLVPITAGEPCR